MVVWCGGSDGVYGMSLGIVGLTECFLREFERRKGEEQKGGTRKRGLFWLVWGFTRVFLDMGLGSFFPSLYLSRCGG